VSVPVWGVALSGPLPVVGLVRRYRTNYLMGRSPLPQPRKFPPRFLNPVSVCGISSPFGLLSPAEGQVSYVLRTRSPLGYIAAPPFDLHVLGTPPAFILSQDQTLRPLTALASIQVLTPEYLSGSFVILDPSAKDACTFVCCAFLSRFSC
jgi:hypothetical protein